MKIFMLISSRTRDSSDLKSEEPIISASIGLRCRISPGQFSGELAVSAQDFKDVKFSLFVDSAHVEHECPEIGDGVECDGRLIVDILEQKQGLALIRLPGRTFGNGSTVTVRTSQLEELASSHA
jgi:hypothetical protein